LSLDAAGGGKAVFVFQVEAGALPRVQKPTASGQLSAVVVSSQGDKASVNSSLGPVAVRAGEREAGKLDTNGLELKDLTPGTLGLALGEGGRGWNGFVEVGPGAIVTAIVSPAVRPPSILVQVSGADSVGVVVDGTPRGATSGGMLRMDVEPGSHEIRVVKDGYLPAKPQKTRAEQGKQSRVAFVLVPRPTATPVAASVALVGKVQLDVSPSSAQITYVRKGESTPQRASAGLLELDEGEYVFSARAPGHVENSSGITVKAGAVQNLSLNLAAVAKPRAQPVVHKMNEAEWDNPWSREGEWYVRRGGGFILYNITPTAGTFQFTVRTKGGKDRWALGFLNGQSYILFELDKQQYNSTEYRGGRKTPHTEKKKLNLKDEAHTIRMTVEPNRVVVTLLAGNQAVTLDEWTRSDGAFTNGKFGFFPSGTQFWLGGFSFTSLPQ
jgi:hypothetical protein